MSLNFTRDILVVITTIATVLGIFIKTLNKFFLETIKCRYKMVPGKQSIFDTILKSIMLIISAISVLFSFVMVLYTLIQKGNNISANELLNLSTNIYQLIGFIVAMLFYCLMFMTQKVFRKLQNMFIKKMGENLHKYYGKSKVLSKNSNSLMKYIKNIIDKINSIDIKKMNIINILISMFFVGSSLSLISLYITKGISKEDIESVCILSLIFMVGLISLVISISLINVVEIVQNNYIYEIVMDQEIILCRCYLEYDEHYLIIHRENERYICKGKVKEIRKFKGFKIEI